MERKDVEEKLKTREVKSELGASGGVEDRMHVLRNRAHTFSSLTSFWKAKLECDEAKGDALRQPQPLNGKLTEKTRKEHFTGNDKMSVEEGKRVFLPDGKGKLNLSSILPARTDYSDDDGNTQGERCRSRLSNTATRAREINKSRHVQPRFVDTFNMEVKELVQNVCCDSDELLDDNIIIVHQPNEQRHLNIGKRFERLPIFHEPQHLIRTGNHKFVINDAAMKQINYIDLPMSIVSICGLYRTGKSYLMNKLANEKRGFTVGHGVSSETKGIWVWCKPHPKQKNTVLMLLDIEGMADIKKGSEAHDNDIKMFCLANLLSSTIIYNHKGVFDQDALEKLSFITRMTENVRNTGGLSHDVNDVTLRLLTPTFVMCLRDFHLKLQDENRSFNDADEYFESTIEISQEPGHESNNKTKECIHKYYPKRKCITIPQPTLDLAMLDDLDEKDLHKDFLTGLNKLKEFVYDRKPKVLDAVTNKVADGIAFEAFARTYVRALEKGESMTYTSAFIQASKYHNGKLCVQITKEYREEVAAIPLPVAKKEKLQYQCFRLKRRKLEIFRSQAYPYFTWNFENKAMDKMKDIENEKMNENTKVVQETLTKTLECIHTDLSGGFDLSPEDFLEMEKRFLSETRDFDDDEQAAAFFQYIKKTKAILKEAEIAAKLQEEKKKQEMLRRRRFKAMSSNLEDQVLKIKHEMQEAMKKEQDEMKRNYIKAMGRHTSKGKPLWKRFMALFKWENIFRN